MEAVALGSIEAVLQSVISGRPNGADVLQEFNIIQLQDFPSAYHRRKVAR